MLMMKMTISIVQYRSLDIEGIAFLSSDVHNHIQYICSCLSTHLVTMFDRWRTISYPNIDLPGPVRHSHHRSRGGHHTD